MSQTLDLSKWIRNYVELRDKIKAMEEEHKTLLKPFKQTLEEVGNLLLSHLTTIGGDSVRSEHGTVYRTEKKSASLADKTAFREYVEANGDWDLLDLKANVTAVEDYIKEHGVQPPGVNFSRMFTVGVRRA